MVGELTLLALMLVTSTYGLVVGIRSRVRVRRLMALAPSAGDPVCTIDRPGAQRFFAETRVLRAALEDQLDTHSDVLTDLDDDASLRVANLERAAYDWQQLFNEGLDDEDREALASRGITRQRVDALSAANGKTKLAVLSVYVSDIHDIEARLTQAPRLSAYR